MLSEVAKSVPDDDVDESQGKRLENVAMERFFMTLKVEQTSRHRYETTAQAKLDVVDWIEGFYNRQRIHSSIAYRTPCDYEAMQKAA